jgi:hypothetical protein
VDDSCHVNELMKRRARPLSAGTRNWDHAQNRHEECIIYPEEDEELGRSTELASGNS